MDVQAPRMDVGDTEVFAIMFAPQESQTAGAHIVFDQVRAKRFSRHEIESESSELVDPLAELAGNQSQLAPAVWMRTTCTPPQRTLTPPKTRGLTFPDYTYY